MQSSQVFSGGVNPSFLESQSQHDPPKNYAAAATERQDGAVLITFHRQEHVAETSVTGKNRPSFINLHGL
ncbi:hypothetical protein E4U23_003733 [Claviceps purpurea]|nr:hypothetical protein E4U23_003733 [Claviceps purpurea]